MYYRITSNQPPNEDMVAVALENGSAYLLRNADYSRYILTSELDKAKRAKEDGWKVVGEIHARDFGLEV